MEKDLNNNELAKLNQAVELTIMRCNQTILTLKNDGTESVQFHETQLKTMLELFGPSYVHHIRKKDIIGLIYSKTAFIAARFGSRYNQAE